MTTADIEGEHLDRMQVRSSVARRLGIPTAGLPKPERQIDGLVEVLLDATGNAGAPLTEGRLKSWHGALFPAGRSGVRRIAVGQWRRGPEPMRVVSGPEHRQTVHYEAPPARRIGTEMTRFLDWFASDGPPADGLLRAGLAHFWFVTIHPFEDGNGRIARAIGDMALARDEGTGVRLYSLSSQIRAERDAYYAMLESAQSGSGELTEWQDWFLGCVLRAIDSSREHLDRVLAKARFWQRHGGAELSERQLKVFNRLLDAGPGRFEGGLTTRKFVAITRASRATAQREIADLVKKGFLLRRPGGGRSTSYDVAW